MRVSGRARADQQMMQLLLAPPPASSRQRLVIYAQDDQLIAVPRVVDAVRCQWPAPCSLTRLESLLGPHKLAPIELDNEIRQTVDEEWSVASAFRAAT
jgi:hypothetical protein